MYPGSLGFLILVLGVVNAIWMAGVTVVLWRNSHFLRRFFSGNNDFNGTLDFLSAEIKDLEGFKKGSAKFINKIALKRFNPYKDTGGDQSFSVVFLDQEENGVVLTSLHSRGGTRIFAKPVKMGKEDDFRFSDEEAEIVKEALSKKN